MREWAQRNPMAARITLRFVLRMGVALAVVLPGGVLCDMYGVSPNIAAIAAVVLGLWLGGRAAAWVAEVWELPPET